VEEKGAEEPGLVIAGMAGETILDTLPRFAEAAFFLEPDREIHPGID
jgi:hypothetical protein